MREQPDTRRPGPADSRKSRGDTAASEAAREAARQRELQEKLDEALAATFPASDPVAILTSADEDNRSDS